MESGVVIELQYDIPLWGLQAPGFSRPRILDSVRKTVAHCVTTSVSSLSLDLEKPALGALAVLTLVVTPV
jgi:hypothetical protein